MINFIKKIVKQTPIGATWNAFQDNKRRKYVAGISSTEPIYPFYCIGCNRYYKHFEPLASYYEEMFVKFGFPYSIHKTETLNTVNYKCPGCGINDRDRLFALYLQQTIQPSKQYDLVEFAPSTQLSDFIHRYKNIRHRTADLFMDGVDDKADLMDMPVYSDNSFDIFICSHILEHVDDDVKAMKELYRILRPGGFGIAMVPIFLDVKQTKEDPSIKDEATRWKNFGQDDHIRLYAGNEYVERLKSAGFIVHQYGKDHFGKEVFKKHGLSETSVLYIVEKSAD